MVEIYNELSVRYGQRNWWPVIQGDECLYLPEFQERKRTPEEIFEIITGAILTQNTAWPNVVKAIIRLKQAGIFSPADFETIPVSELAELIRPAGYFNQKAKKLKIIACFIRNDLRGDILSLEKFPLIEARKKLLDLWGIGPETADSILLYGYGFPVFVVDAYTKRVFSRLGFFPEKSDYEEVRQLFEKGLPKDVRLYREYHALIVEFAKEFCRKKTPCDGCFLQNVLFNKCIFA
ncbi:MAG: endonuclease III domain-containing protein [Patescibacteria group bacterium]|nr:endonuclease III domain-containing protein [Patescibacteria group bacterium]